MFREALTRMLDVHKVVTLQNNGTNAYSTWLKERLTIGDKTKVASLTGHWIHMLEDERPARHSDLQLANFDEVKKEQAGNTRKRNEKRRNRGKN